MQPEAGIRHDKIEETGEDQMLVQFSLVLHDGSSLIQLCKNTIKKDAGQIIFIEFRLSGCKRSSGLVLKSCGLFLSLASPKIRRLGNVQINLALHSTFPIFVESI